MNPRVSRSSALASKATGFPIAKIAARLAVGYTLDEIPNDITRAHARELRADDRLRGRQVAAVRVREVPRRRRGPLDAHEVGRRGDGDRAHVPAGVRARRCARASSTPRRLDGDGEPARRASRRPAPTASTCCSRCSARGASERGGPRAHRRSTRGSCASCASWRSIPRRRSPASRTFKAVDTCAAEFAAETPYYYSAWERAAAPTRSARGDKPSVMILGSGPNRIGQGIEFDYCCVHAAMTVRESGRDAVMVNCNPETVSTDYDTSDRLYFEPLTLEDVLGDRRGRAARGRDRPVRRPDAAASSRPGWRRRACRCSARSRRRSTWPRTAARFGALLDRLGLQGAAVRDRALAPRRRWRRAARRLPAARAPELRARRPRDGDRLRRRRPRATTCARVRGPTGARSSSTASWRTRSRSTSTRSATARTSGSAAIMQHVEEAGIHSGDSACVLPPHSLGARDAATRSATPTRGIALALGVVGLINVQYARARRRPLRDRGQPARVADGAVRLQGDRPAAGQARLPGDARREARRPRAARRPGAATTSSVKEAVLPFDRFAGADALLGPGDALDRRGDGRRRRLPGRVRQGAGGGGRAAAARRAPCSSR